VKAGIRLEGLRVEGSSRKKGEEASLGQAWRRDEGKRRIFRLFLHLILVYLEGLFRAGLWPSCK